MNNEIVIVSAGTGSNQTKAQEYMVLSHHFKGDRMHSGSYRIDELLKFVIDLKPELITIFTADMHGRTIVSFLEYFLSRKFKSVIYELSSGHRGKVHSRIVVIKMQKYV
ncbi:hypothetical protein [Candidatus Nitrosocosmicus sp. R]